MMFRIIAVGACLLAVTSALAGPPTGYRCGNGKPVRGVGCQCPAGTTDARDAEGIAICQVAPPKPAQPPKKPVEKAGTVEISTASDPNLGGAAIFVDGLSQGTAPTTIQVTVGRHLVELKKPGFEPFSQWITLQDKQRFMLAAVLRPIAVKQATGMLVVDATLPDAEVIVDGNSQADRTPLVISLNDGYHVVEVRKPPATPWKQTVQVKSGVQTKVRAELVVPAPSTPTTPPATPSAPSEPPVPGALASLDKSCRANDGRACNNLGAAWSDGKDGAPNADHRHARFYYERACKLSHGLGCFNLGNVHRLGEGVPKSESTAVGYYQTACSLDTAKGCTELAISYYEGRGIEKNQDLALQLMEKACRLGSPTACKNVELIKKK